MALAFATIKCAICMEPSNNRIDLHAHLKNVHNEDMREQDIKFDSIEDFNVWKKEEETKNSTVFRIVRRSVTKFGTTHLFHCKKSGHFCLAYKCSGIKENGKCHCPPTCPAKMFLTEYDLKKEVVVVYLDKHLGHDNSPVTRFRSAHPCHKPKKTKTDDTISTTTTTKNTGNNSQAVTLNNTEIANAVNELISQSVGPSSFANNTANSSGIHLDNDQSSSYDCNYEDDYQDAQPIEVATVVNYNQDTGVTTTVADMDFLSRYMKLNFQNQNLVKDYINRLYEIQEQYSVQQQQPQLNTIPIQVIQYHQQNPNFIFQQQLQQQQHHSHNNNNHHQQLQNQNFHHHRH